MLTAPLGQMRRVQTLPAQKRSDLPGLRTGLRFLQYAPFVTGAEPATLGFGNHLRQRSLPDGLGVQRIREGLINPVFEAYWKLRSQGKDGRASYSRRYGKNSGGSEPGAPPTGAPGQTYPGTAINDWRAL